MNWNLTNTSGMAGREADRLAFVTSLASSPALNPGEEKSIQYELVVVVVMLVVMLVLSSESS